DGNASPVLADLAGNNTNQLIVANSDGIIHAYQYNPNTGGVSDLPGWPVHTDPLPLHTGEHAFSSGEVSTAHYGSVIEAPAAGDPPVYAWHADGSAVRGFTVLVSDPDKMASVDLQSNQITFNSNAPANPGRSETQGKIVDTLAIAHLDGPSNPPSIVVGTNEEYLVNRGNEGEINASHTTTASLGVLGSLLNFANGRVYAINASGASPLTLATGGF